MRRTYALLFWPTKYSICDGFVFRRPIKWRSNWQNYSFRPFLSFFLVKVATVRRTHSFVCDYVAVWLYRRTFSCSLRWSYLANSVFFFHRTLVCASFVHFIFSSLSSSSSILQINLYSLLFSYVVTRTHRPHTHSRTISFFSAHSVHGAYIHFVVMV